MSRKVFIFDTTLRDGEQSPGVSFNAFEKMAIAKQLAHVGVDVIEAGFPFSPTLSREKLEIVLGIAEEIRGPVICALARVLPGDIDVAAEALKPAIDRGKGLIHVFIGTSDILVEKQLRKTRDEVLEMSVGGVKYAKRFCPEVEFSAMDAGRTDRGYLREVVGAVIEAGATIVNIPDTVGWNLPYRFAEIITDLRVNVAGIKDVRLSVHAHDDLGNATAESIEAVRAGVTQIECAVNGIGERAGNAPLEEIVMNISLHGGDLDAHTDIQIDKLLNTSRIVGRITGFPVPPNKAVVGENVPRTSSGIHQDGILKDPRTFQPYDPQSVGHRQGDSRDMSLNIDSGRSGLRSRLEKLGYGLSDEDLDKIYERFIEIASQKKDIFDEDLVAIADDELPGIPQSFSLGYFWYRGGPDDAPPRAQVGLYKEGVTEMISESAEGDGPVDAAYKAIDKITGFKVELADYSISAATKGKDAMGEVTVRIREDDRIIIGHGASTDIIEASAKAYLNAINKMLVAIAQK